MSVGLSGGLDLYARNSATGTTGYGTQGIAASQDKQRNEPAQAVPESLEISTESTKVSISSEARLRAAAEADALAASRALDQLQPPVWLTELTPPQQVPPDAAVTAAPAAPIAAYAGNGDPVQAHAASVGEYNTRLNQIYQSVLQSNQLTTTTARDTALADSQQSENLRSQVVKAIQADARMMDLATTLGIPLAG